MKKSFTLTEVLISILLLSIIFVFLIQVLNSTKKSEQSLAKSATKIEKVQNLKQLIFDDILYSLEVETIATSDKNTILFLKTKNSFYDVLNSNVTYILSKENNLFRIESKTAIKNRKDATFENLEKARIVKLLENVSSFKVKPLTKIEDSYAIYIKIEKQELFFTAIPFENANKK